MAVSGDFEYWTRIATKLPIGFNKDANIYLRKHSGQLSNQFSSMVSRIREDIPIMQKLMEMANVNDKKKLFSCWQWKIQTMYLNEVFLLLRNRKIKFALDALREIKKVSFLPTLFIRWMLVKFLR